MTIIIIAHRLTTIESADNLLYFKSRSELVSASKGTPEYSEIFEKLKCISYTYGDNDGGEDEDEMSPNDMEEQPIIEEEDETEDNRLLPNAESNWRNPGLLNSRSSPKVTGEGSQNSMTEQRKPGDSSNSNQMTVSLENPRFKERLLS